jgi:hypothetical protein
MSFLQVVRNVGIARELSRLDHLKHRWTLAMIAVALLTALSLILMHTSVLTVLIETHSP